MTLRLSVVSEHGTRLGAQSTKVFGVHGGTIGRGTDNEWSLPDPERYLSVKHARIDCRAGTYILVDTSSNGTYVNGAPVPLEKHRDYPLRDGDFVRLGEYELLVSIDLPNDIAQAAVDSAITPWNMMTRPLKASAPTNGAATVAVPAAVPIAGLLAAPVAIPTSVAAAAASTPLPPLLDGDLDAGLAAFCHGAGIDPHLIAPLARAAALQLAGQLLRESVLGLMHLNQHRDELHNRFHIPPAPEEPADLPLNLTHGVDEALARLLASVAPHSSSVEAVRDNFRQLNAQHVATEAAMRTAFEEFIERMAPKELEERFDRGAKRGVFGQSKARNWELYAGIYSGLVQRPADGFPHLFTEAFAKAYVAKLRTLIPPPRSACGAERNECSEPRDSAARDDRAVGAP